MAITTAAGTGACPAMGAGGNGGGVAGKTLVGEIEREVGGAKIGGAKAVAVGKTTTVGKSAATIAGKAATVTAGANGGTAVLTKGAIATGGTIWTGKGLSLGLGLGLGVWGPILLGAVSAAAIYGYVRSRKVEATGEDAD
ncbi:MAG: magnetic particle specific iron-binding protein [Magnetospirillum sp. WYHS-4]